MYVLQSKSYEILDGLPPYGPMYVSITGNDQPSYSEGFVIRFYKADKTSWVANFEQGWTGLKFVAELASANKFLVIASGRCYIINSEEEKLLDVFGGSYSLVLKTSDKRLILQDQTDLTIVEHDGGHWDTERISWDGLRDVQLNGNVVTGFSCQPTYTCDEWTQFSYNLVTRKLIGGSFPQSKPSKNPLWRFW